MLATPIFAARTGFLLMYAFHTAKVFVRASTALQIQPCSFCRQMMCCEVTSQFVPYRQLRTLSLTIGISRNENALLFNRYDNAGMSRIFREL